jgi:hypothetical protein
MLTSQFKILTYEYIGMIFGSVYLMKHLILLVTTFALAAPVISQTQGKNKEKTQKSIEGKSSDKNQDNHGDSISMKRKSTEHRDSMRQHGMEKKMENATNKGKDSKTRGDSMKQKNNEKQYKEDNDDNEKDEFKKTKESDDKQKKNEEVEKSENKDKVKKAEEKSTKDEKKPKKVKKSKKQKKTKKSKKEKKIETDDTDS